MPLDEKTQAVAQALLVSLRSSGIAYGYSKAGGWSHGGNAVNGFRSLMREFRSFLHHGAYLLTPATEQALREMIERQHNV
jgi:hypothetical protein